MPGVGDFREVTEGRFALASGSDLTKVGLGWKPEISRREHAMLI